MTLPRSDGRINWRAATILLAALVLGGATVVIVEANGASRLARSALAQARRARSEGATDLAIRHLTQFHDLYPRQIEPLELLASLLTETAVSPDQLAEAAKTNDLLLRVDPEGAGRQETRRRLVRIYLDLSRAHRQSDIYAVAPEIAAAGLRDRAAVAVARDLLRRGPGKAEDHRLLAMSLEDAAERGDADALTEAIREFEVARSLDPDHLDTNERLARLYQERRKDVASAERILRALPDTVEGQMVRYRHHARFRNDVAARAALDAALRHSPDDPAIHLEIAKTAQRTGDLAEARRHLGKVPIGSPQEAAAIVMRGGLALNEGKGDDAVAEWRAALKASGGNDINFVFHLAWALLEAGRTEEARPLVSQHRRLAGDTIPRTLFLQAVLDQQTGRLIRAVGELEALRPRLEATLQGALLLALGKAQEALGDPSKALEAYRAAERLDDFWDAPFLLAADLLVADRPDEAVSELDRALVRQPRNPLRLLIKRAQIRFLQQAALPPARRSWSTFEDAVSRAAGLAPDDPALARLRAARLILDGQPAEALPLLTEATTRHPRDEGLWLALADAYVADGRPEEGEATLVRAISDRRCRDSAALRLARSRLLHRIGREQESRDVLSRGGEVLPLPERAQLWKALGERLIEAGDAGGARRAYEEWEHLVPDDARPKLARLRVELDAGDLKAARVIVEGLKASGTAGLDAWRQGRAQELIAVAGDPKEKKEVRAARLEEAGRLLDQILADAPNLPTIQLWRGIVFERQGRAEEAIACYRRAGEGREDAALPHLVKLLVENHRLEDLEQLGRSRSELSIERLAAEMAARQGDTALASKLVLAVLARDPERLATLKWQAIVRLSIGEGDAAEAAMRALAEKQVSRTEPWLALLRIQVARGRYEAAKATSREIVSRSGSERPELLMAECQLILGDPDLAETAADEAAGRWPEDIDVAVRVADIHRKSGHPAKAEAQLRRVLGPSESAEPARLELAEILASRVYDRDAWREAASLAKDVPEPARRFAHAVVMLNAPEEKSRRAAFETMKALSLSLPAAHPLASKVHLRLARIEHASGNLFEAVRHARAAATQTPNPSAEAIAVYALTLTDTKRLGQADQEIERLAIEAPLSLDLFRLRVRRLQFEGREAPMIALLESTARQSDVPPATAALAREAITLLATLNRLEEAERAARDHIGRRPEDTWVLARVLARRGQPEAALTLLSKVSDRGISRDDGLTAMAIVEPRATPAGLQAEALKIVEKAFSLFPEDVDLLTAAATLYHRQGRFEDTVRAYRKIESLHPTDYRFLNNLAWDLSEGLHRPAEAIAPIDEAIRRIGRLPGLLDTRGVILTRLGRTGEAIADFEEAARTQPSPSVQFHLTRAYKAAGRSGEFEKALADIRRLNLTPDAFEAGERKEFAALVGP